MKKFKQIIAQIITTDPITQALQGTHLQSKYLEAVNLFLDSNHIRKEQIIQRILNRLKKKHKLEKTLGPLFLIHHLIDHGVNLVIMGFNHSDTYDKSQKLQVAEQKLLQFYFEYLKLQSRRASISNKNNLAIEAAIKDAVYSQQAIILFIRADFILKFCLKHLNSNNLVLLIITRIIQQTRDNLVSINKFIEKWAYLIIEKSTLSIEINSIYEKLIYINKEYNKLQILIKLTQSNVVLPVYTVNKQLNVTIEKQMLSRSKEMVIQHKEEIKQSETLQLYVKDSSNPVSPGPLESQCSGFIFKDQFI